MTGSLSSGLRRPLVRRWLIPCALLCLVGPARLPGESPGFECYRRAADTPGRLEALRLLGANPPPGLVRDLLEALAQPPAEAEVSEAIQQCLAAQGAEALPELARELRQDRIPAYRLSRVVDLIAETDPEALSAWLTDPDPGLGEAALAALGRSGHPVAAAVLFRYDPFARPETAATFLESAVKLDPARGTAVMGDCLHSLDRRLQLAALSRATVSRQEALKPDVLPLLASPDPEVVSQAIHFFNFLGPAGVSEALAAAFESLSPPRQQELIYAFRVPATEAEIALLQRVFARNGPDVYLGRQACRSLKNRGLVERNPDARPVYLRVENFRPGDAEIEVVLLTAEGLAVCLAGQLRSGCWGRKAASRPIGTSDYSGNGRLHIRLNCRPKPCAGACAELVFTTPAGVILRYTAYLDRFFTC